MKPNCIPASETLESYAKSISLHAIEISPVKSEGEEIAMCGVAERDHFSIYGRDPDGAAHILHDVTDGEIGPWLQLIHDVTNLPVIYSSAEIYSFEYPNTQALAEWLTEQIHDDIPSVEAENFRDDDFDNHPLAELRESICDACGYTGEPIKHAKG